MEVNDVCFAIETTDMKNFISEELGLPKMILFGDEWIELDESMVFYPLCSECVTLGYCKKKNAENI